MTNKFKKSKSRKIMLLIVSFIFLMIIGLSCFYFGGKLTYLNSNMKFLKSYNSTFSFILNIEKFKDSDISKKFSEIKQTILNLESKVKKIKNDDSIDKKEYYSLSKKINNQKKALKWVFLDFCSIQNNVELIDKVLNELKELTKLISSLIDTFEGVKSDSN
ncbi:hypothetical protein A0H76_822 [Hepatospora eriocheir]|uniref:Uncharacterized protein n=1 Tax=Hepatospora eriocheir TaxID=1081669 RepID=A0A1X0QI49_9MICR|nr:hypothetical protein A0H76_822 [Hepatospora eriocheir]